MAALVSVVLPTRDRAGLLPEAVASVLAQSRADLELIVVDDGSTDDTARVVAAFADPRVRYLRQDPRGIGAAMNAGIAAARGELVARIDSDDRWLPALLAKQAAVLETRSEVDLVYAKARAMDAEGRPLARTLGAPERWRGRTLESLLYGDFGCAIATLVRRRCYEGVGGYDPDLRTNEDWDLWIRLARAGCRFHFLDEVLAEFRCHPGRSTTSALSADVLESRLRPLDKVFADPWLPAGIRALRPLAYCNAHVDLGVRCLGAARPREARLHFGRALAAGEARLPTLLRIAWQILLHRSLSRRRWAVRAVEAAVRLRG